MKNRLRNIFFCLSLVIISIPIILEDINNSLFYYIGSLFLLSLIITDKSVIYRHKLSGCIILFITYALNSFVELSTISFSLLMLILAIRDLYRYKNAIYMYSFLLICAVFFQIIVYGVSFYPNSEKGILLFWNPNVFWVIYSLLFIFSFKNLKDKKIKLLLLVVTAFLIYSYGTSRLAIVIFCIYFLNRFKLLFGLKPFLITLILSLTLILRLYWDILIEYDYLSNNRLQSTLNGARVQRVSDMPILDIRGFRLLIFICIWIYLILNSSKHYLVNLLYFLLIFIFDSSIYAPLVIVMFFMMFSDKRNYYLHNKNSNTLKFKSIIK